MLKRLLKEIKSHLYFYIGFIIGVPTLIYSIYFNLTHGGLYYSSLVMLQKYPTEEITMIILLSISLILINFGDIKKKS